MAKTKQAEPDLDLEDLDLEDLDMEDLEDIDLGDETEDEETEQEVPDTSDDLDLEDEDEDEEEEDEDDDEDELDLEDEDEPDASADDDDLDLDDEDEPEPPKRTRRAPAKAQSNGDAPLSEAQRTLLGKAVKSKRGYVKYTVPGQVRTAKALIDRKLAKAHGKGAIEPTQRGRKEIENVGSTRKAPAKAPKATQAPAKRRGRPKGSTGATGPRELPKGRYGIADVAKAAGGAPEPTVRRVLDLNSDEFNKENGRWAFTKADATKLAKKVKLYIKHTGGRRGRPKGSTNRLPDGKVGVSGIATQAGVSQQTVYVWLRAHNDKVKKFKQDGSWAFPEKVAKQIAGRLS